MFKLRSTPEGEPPIRGDILRTLKRGIPGSAMPSYGSLSEGDRRALAEYVMALAKFEETPEETLKIPPVPPATKASVKRGKFLYGEFGCNECHGPKGDGKGTSAAGMKDNKGRPILPNDFTRGVFKGGGDPKSVMTRFMTGMDGTPMPSFSESAKPDQLVALTQYVLSLSKGREVKQPGTGILSALRVSKLPRKPADRRWNQVKPAIIPMMHLHNDGRLPLSIAVRAVHDGKRLSVLVEWTDASRDTKAQTITMFADAAAVQYSLRAKNPPLFTMGMRGDPVNIWFWNAAAARGPSIVEAKYPGMAVDDYPFAGKVYPRRKMGPPKAIVSARMTKPPFITAWAVKNPISAPGRSRGVMDLNAEGFGTLQPQGPKGQNVTGSGRWANGKWRVVFTRSLKSADEGDVGLLPGSLRPIGFALWDGSRRDRNGQKSVTTWYSLRVQ
jgi:mono/diheme cytochrome c family protein